MHAMTCKGIFPSEFHFPRRGTLQDIGGACRILSRAPYTWFRLFPVKSSIRRQLLPQRYWCPHPGLAQEVCRVRKRA